MTTGQIVRAKAGRDKGMLFVVMGREERYVFLCDGKNRTIESPKKKKDIHVAPTKTLLDPNEIKTDKAIRKALREFAEQD